MGSLWAPNLSLHLEGWEAWPSLEDAAAPSPLHSQNQAQQDPESLSKQKDALESAVQGGFVAAKVRRVRNRRKVPRCPTLSLQAGCAP